MSRHPAYHHHSHLDRQILERYFDDQEAESKIAVRGSFVVDFPVSSSTFLIDLPFNIGCFSLDNSTGLLGLH